MFTRDGLQRRFTAVFQPPGAAKAYFSRQLSPLHDFEKQLTNPRQRLVLRGRDGLKAGPAHAQRQGPGCTRINPAFMIFFAWS